DSSASGTQGHGPVSTLRKLKSRVRLSPPAFLYMPITSFSAIDHIVTAITPSRIRHEDGRAKTGRSQRAPKPSEKKNRRDAVIAPAANDVSKPGNCVEIVPRRTTVSR